MSRVASQRSIIGVILIVLLTLGLFTAIAETGEFPTKPLTIINPWSVGGGVDRASRALAKEMEKISGPVVVESRPGATGLRGGDYVVKAEPDGYTMGVFGDSEFCPEAYSAMRKAPYSSDDLEPVIRWFVLPYGISSRTDRPWKNLDEFIKYIKAHPNKVRLGHTGVGHTYHTLWYNLAKKHNLKVVEVPFAGAGPAKTALRGGHVDFALTSVSSVQGFIQEGTVKMLAIHHPHRFSEFPNVPTFEELGYLPGYPYNLKGMWVPVGTPEARKKKIHDIVKEAIETPGFKAFAKKSLFDPYYGTPDDLRAAIKAAKEIIAPLVEEVSRKYKK
jgi:tripartite-type tricarboxylate transporter receptor subunit TctC